MVNEYKVKKFYYLMVLIIVVLGCLYFAAKTLKMNNNEGAIMYATHCEDTQTFITPDIVPHIREIKDEDKKVRPCQPDPEDNPDGIEYC